MCLLPVTILGVRRSHFFFSVLSSWSISTVFEFFPFGFLAVCRWVPGTGRAQGRCAEPACCRLQVELGSYALLSPPRWPWQRHSPGSVLTRVSPRLGPSGPHELVESPLALGGHTVHPCHLGTRAVSGTRSHRWVFSRRVGTRACGRGLGVGSVFRF